MESTSGGSGNLGSELRGDASTVASSATQRVHSEIDARKGEAAGQVRAVSSALNRASEQLGQDGPSWLRSAFDSVSQTVERLADTVEQKDSRRLTDEVQQIARQHPGSFLAACAFAGFAAARVMQAGARGNTPGDRGPSDGGSSVAAGASAPPQSAFPLAGGADAYVMQSPVSGGVL